MQEKLLTVEQVAEYLGVHRDTVYAMVRSGRLKAFQLGGRKASWRIVEDDLRSFIDGRRTAQTREAAADDLAQDRQRALDYFDSQQRAEMDALRERQTADRREFLADQDEVRRSRSKRVRTV